MEGEHLDEEEDSWQEILLPEGTRMDLPTGLLQSRSVLDLFFHPDTWAPHVSEDLKRRLWELLPKGISDEERSDGVDALFRGEAIRFGRNRLEDLKADLLSGGMDPVRAGMRRMLRRAEEEQSGERHAERAYQDAKDLVAKRKQVLEEVGAPSASKVPQSVLGMTQKSVPAAFDIDHEVGKEYMSILSSIMAKVDGGPRVLMERDALYPNGIPKKRHKGRKRPLIAVTDEPPPAPPELPMPPMLNRSSSSSSLLKRASTTDDDSDSSSGRQRRTQHLQQQPPAKRLPLRPPPPLPPLSVKDKTVVDQAVANIPGMEEDEEDLDVGLDEALVEIHPPPPPKASERPSSSRPPAERRKSPSSFFSLLRDIFKSNPGHRLGVVGLEKAVGEWKPPNRAECSWVRREYSIGGWCKEVPSAVAFLCGHFPDAEPPNFQPYLALTPDCAGVYRWTGGGGGGRDSDAHLAELTRWWTERRDRCEVGSRELLRLLQLPSGSETGNDELDSSAAGESREEREARREEFRRQERERFSRPDECFVYTGRAESLVGPVERVRVNKRVSGGGQQHPLLRPDAPSFATFRQLVRDAVCRLPRGGRGSAYDVARLVSQSSMISDRDDEEGIVGEVIRTLSKMREESPEPFVAVIAGDRSKEREVVYRYNHFGKTKTQLLDLHRKQLIRDNLLDHLDPKQRSAPSSTASNARARTSSSSSAAAPSSLLPKAPLPQAVQIKSSSGRLQTCQVVGEVSPERPRPPPQPSAPSLLAPAARPASPQKQLHPRQQGQPLQQHGSLLRQASVPPTAPAPTKHHIVKDSEGRNIQLTPEQYRSLVNAGAILPPQRRQQQQVQQQVQQPSPAATSTSVSMAANAAIQQVLASTSATRPAGPAAPTVAAAGGSAAVKLPILSTGGGVGGPAPRRTATIPCLNLSQSPASEVMKIVTSLSQQPQQPQQVILQQQQRRPVPAPAPPPPVQQQQVFHQVRLPTPLPAGQRVSLDGKHFVVAGTDSSGQTLLAPVEQQQQVVLQQPQQQLMIQQPSPQPQQQQQQQILLNPSPQQNVLIQQQQMQQLLGKQVVPRMLHPPGGGGK